VIGYGSIGRRHARVLAGASASLAIVIRREGVRTQAQQDHPAACVVDRLEALDETGFPWDDALAIIATWGPSHSDFFSRLADRGVRHILCEKPMAVSVGQAAEMVRRAEADGIALGVNHCLRYAELVPSLRQFLALHDLGEPVAVIVSGGANCLVTNGIHWVDFAIELFAADPHEVVGLVHGDPINPRSTELLYFGGAATWRFPGGREAVIVSSNSSSIESVVRVYLPDAVVELSYEAGPDDIYVGAVIRQADGVDGSDAVFAQRARPGEPLFRGRLPGVRLFLEGIRAAIEDVAHGGATRSPGSAGATAVSAVVGALSSGREGRAFDLPVPPSSPAGRHAWPIS
jgi:predicted dehydrogenase